MADSNKLNDSSQRRRSPRLTPSLVNAENNNMAHDSNVPVKRSITVRKIAPRKTTPASEHNKENTPRRPEEGQQKRQRISTPGPVRVSRRSSSAKKKVAVPSPILSPPTPGQRRPQQPAEDPSDAVWSQKVRRSYTRISDKSFNSPDSRETLFGFEMLQTPEVRRRGGRGKAALEVSSIASGPSSFILDTEDCVPDLNIPGVALVKEKKKSRRKLQQIDVTEVDVLSAKMNAEFQEAEQFELVVE
ncbi:sororin [Phyllopteryx taeniolatus]|uniref:sororin n=1 Tax=Phyllopteryx taeniolatus TaxID=161469 RepID=UPI002AD2258E|nr:sororin [Phyllopteryx taeniolatus]